MIDYSRVLRALVEPGQLPPEFDKGFYRRIYEDLNELSEEQLNDHYYIHGIREGRIGSPAALRAAFIGLIDAASSALEIGPFTNPVLRGKNIRYFDVLNRERLIDRAVELKRNAKFCPEIHYVSPTGDLGIIEDKFDIVFSSHCIEHQPDLVKHLNDISNIIPENGRYFLCIPDKRYCFDALLPESTLEQVLAAHAEQRRTHTLKSVVDHYAHTTHNDPARHWQGDSGGITDKHRMEREKQALERFNLSDGEYIDVHAWQFTPSAFSAIIHGLGAHKLTSLRLERAYNTPRGAHEFTAVLTK